MGEWRTRAELRPAAAPRLPPLRDRRRPSLPLGSLLADLERAEQAALAPADEVEDLRPPPAQPWVRGDPCRAAARPGRWRRDRASRRVGGRRTRHVATWHGRRGREVRRLRPPPVPLEPGRDAVEPRLPRVPVDHDGDDQEAPRPRPAPLRAEADLAHRVRLPDESAGHDSGCASEEAGDEARPCGDARLEAAAGDDADPVPLPRRARRSAASRAASCTWTTAGSPR